MKKRRYLDESNMTTLEAQNNTFYIIRQNEQMFVAVEEKDAILKYKELTITVTDNKFPSIIIFTRGIKEEGWNLDVMSPQLIVQKIIALEE